MNLYIGLMSGTSMDGIDAALVDVDKHQLLYGLTKPYSPELQTCLQKLTEVKTLPLASYCQINTRIGEEFAHAVLDLLAITGTALAAIKAIGSHGQTVAHDAGAAIPYTLQLGCAHTIAYRTGIPVVADFRSRDLVLGGQGAPFAPLYHQEVFAAKVHDSFAVINIGGIANISVFNGKEEVQGWDLGPGNCLMDAWIMGKQGKKYDKEGAWASEGKPIPALLKKLQNDDFFRQPAPKSIGKEYYSSAWLNVFLTGNEAPEDVQATLLALSAWCIVRAISPTIKAVYICGGGAHNSALMQAIAAQLPHCTVQASDALGISADYVEAMIFAWLASQTMAKKPVNLMKITGSKQPAILGAVYR